MNFIGPDCYQGSCRLCVARYNSNELLACERLAQLAYFDLLPCFGTKLSMICAKGRGRRYVEEQAHGSADDRGTETVVGGAQSRGRGERSGRIEAYDLRLEGEVRWHGREPGAGGEAVA